MSDPIWERLETLMHEGETCEIEMHISKGRAQYLARYTRRGWEQRIVTLPYARPAEMVSEIEALVRRSRTRA